MACLSTLWSSENSCCCCLQTSTCLLQAMVAGADGYLWVGHRRGRVERYTAGGMLQWYQVGTTP